MGVVIKRALYAVPSVIHTSVSQSTVISRYKHPILELKRLDYTYEMMGSCGYDETFQQPRGTNKVGSRPLRKARVFRRADQPSPPAITRSSQIFLISK